MIQNDDDIEKFPHLRKLEKENVLFCSEWWYRYALFSSYSYSLWCYILYDHCCCQITSEQGSDIAGNKRKRKKKESLENSAWHVFSTIFTRWCVKFPFKKKFWWKNFKRHTACCKNYPRFLCSSFLARTNNISPSRTHHQLKHTFWKTLWLVSLKITEYVCRRRVSSIRLSFPQSSIKFFLPSKN